MTKMVIPTKTRIISLMIKINMMKIIRKRRKKRRTIKMKVNRMKMINKIRMRKILMRMKMRVDQVAHPIIKSRSQRP